MSEAEKIQVETAEKKTVKKTKKVKKVKAKGTTELPDFNKMKVKKTTKAKKTEDKEEAVGLYSYDELLDTVFNLCNNKSKSETKRQIELPQIKMAKEGSKRVVWQNFTDICSKLQRNPEEVKVFVLAELMTIGSLDSQGGFTIKAKLQPHQLENVILSYAEQYVQCPVCKSLDTTLTKENRIQFINCAVCHAHTSAANNKSIAEN